MNKPLTKQQRSENEEFRYTYHHPLEVKELIEKIPEDSNIELTQTYESAAKANEVRMAMYNLRRAVRTFKYFKPDIDDKIARFKAAVQGATLVLRLRPGRWLDAIPQPVTAPSLRPRGSGGAEAPLEPELRSLKESFDFPIEDKPKPEQADPDEGFEFPIRKK